MTQSGQKPNPTAPVPPHEFLLKEHDAAVQLTFHVDDLRAKLSGGFVALAAAVATAASIVLKNDPDKAKAGIAALLLGLALVGAVIVFISARLRRTQLEHFGIINNIRRHFLADDLSLWNVVQLSAKTLPRPSMTSGSYFWVLAIMLPTAGVAGTSMFLLANDDFQLCLAALTGVAVWGGAERLVFPPCPAPCAAELHPGRPTRVTVSELPVHAVHLVHACTACTAWAACTAVFVRWDDQGSRFVPATLQVL